MEIKRGYTLSQFIDEIKKVDASPLYKFQKTLAYNELYKQPLKKEMFVNELEVPLEMYYRPDEGVQKYPQECFLEDKRKFEEAEKKVIFKGFKSTEIEIDNGIKETHYSCGGINIIYAHTSNRFYHIGGDLFEATNGELETQNLEI